MTNTELQKMYVDWKIAKMKGLMCLRVARVMIGFGRFLGILGICPKAYLKSVEAMVKKTAELAIVSHGKFDALKMEIGD